MPFLALNASVLLVVVGVLLAGQRWNRARIFREKMGKHWKVALTLAVIYLLAFLLGTGFASGMFLTEVIGMFGIFCLSLLGTTLARSIGSFEPFPVTQALRERKRMWSRLAWSLGVALLAVPVALVLGIIGTTIASSLFHESIPHTNGSSFFPMGNQSFVNGVQQDKDAVLAGLTLPWSTGPVEGQVNRLKLIKGSM